MATIGTVCSRAEKMTELAKIVAREQAREAQARKQARPTQRRIGHT